MACIGEYKCATCGGALVRDAKGELVHYCVVNSGDGVGSCVACNYPSIDVSEDIYK
jgi:hypothetical protein